MEQSKGRWSARDIITLVAFNAIILVVSMAIQMAGELLLSPEVSYFVVAAVLALVATPFYLVMAYRIGKHGVLATSMMIMALLFSLMGFIYYLPVFAVGAIIGELAMIGKDAYRNPLRATLGYCIYWITFCLCGIIPYILFYDAYAETLASMYPSERVTLMSFQYTDPFMITIMIGLAIVGTLLGGFIGSKLLKKHVKKAKLS